MNNPEASSWRDPIVEDLHALREAYAAAFYMSGYTNNAISQHGMLDSDLAFIQKPLTPEALAKKVCQVLDTPERAPDPSKTRDLHGG